MEFDDQTPVYVWADEFKIEQVVTNYLSNAIHHIDGEKKIIIRMIRRTDSSVYLSSIRNSYPGGGGPESLDKVL